MSQQLKEFLKIKSGDYVVQIKDAVENGGAVAEAYPTGFDGLDRLMRYQNDPKMRGGFRGGELVIVTGKSGAGKTSFCQNLTLNMERDEKLKMPSIWFSYEVSVNNLYEKFKRMGISESALIYTTKRNITGNLSWVKEKICEAYDKFTVRVVFIDDITFLSPTNSKSSDQYRMFLGNIVTELKSFAVEKNIVIVLMAHVRKVERGREIEMEDVAESSAIFQKCDYMFAVIRGMRDEVVNGIKYSVGDNLGYVKVIKNRPFGEQGVMTFEYKNNLMIEKSSINYNDKKI